MITILQIALLRLWNNKQELLLIFVVPILFFSIFALIFGRGVGSDTPAIEVALVDDDRTPLTAEIARLLAEQSALRIHQPVHRTSDRWPLDRLAERVLRDRGQDLVIHMPPQMERRLRASEPVSLQLISEGTNPISRQIVTAMLLQVVPPALARTIPAERHTVRRQPPEGGSRENLRRLPPPPEDAPTDRRAVVPSAGAAAMAPREPAPDHAQLISVETRDLFAAEKHNPKVAMYAAGIAVMFLLFSATGAGGSLLEEFEAGTLDRLLTTRLGLSGLLAGKWLYITGLGCVQLTVMFLWAQFAFSVDLLGHLPGFAVMAVCTAAATASLALCLAVFSRSRTQLNAVSIVLILTMSALGGSMVPRYIMSEQMRRWGRLTFNAWALDGFQKVFWYDQPVGMLTAEVRVLLIMAVVLACLARIYADRWAAD
jgi:ABC-2 type transport system permease protein